MDHRVRVIVVGAGVMGAGIAQVLVEADVEVALVDVSTASLQRAAEGVRRGLERRHRDDPSKATSLYGSLRTCAELPVGWEPALVIEAVPEDADLKREILTRVEVTYPQLPLLATNTSALSVSSLAGHLARPECFVGMHFFNPVPLSALVEIVAGDSTSAEAVVEAGQWVELIGLESITVLDSPGFATSRLGLAIGLEAIRMLEENVASAEDIDRGMTLGYRFPIGPLRLTDIVGLDVRLAIAEHLHGQLGSRFEPPQLLRRLVSDGRLGKKSGQGFYAW